MPQPFKLTFIVTYRCNQRCVMCSIWQRPTPNELTLEEIRRFFRRNSYFSWINISGGEIFLRDDIVEIMRVMREECRDLYLVDYPTNGAATRVVVEKTQEILRLKPRRLLVTVSLDGHRDLHDRLRGVPKAWDHAVETFRRLRPLRASNFNVFFGMTLSGHNARQFEATFEAVREVIPDLELTDFHLNVAHHSEHYYGNIEVRRQDQLAAAQTLQDFQRRKPRRWDPVSYLEARYQSAVPTYLETGKRPLRCEALSASCFVDPTGMVYPCSMYNRAVANLREHDYDLRGIYALREAVELRREIVAGQCPQCWTPCEAYQAILANMLPFSGRKERSPARG
jgi:MoaA/NifB/PqqE/SkfB family radical SAM enzyme